VDDGMPMAWQARWQGRSPNLTDTLADESYSGLASTLRCETVSMWHLASRRAERQDR
jgi:hypothetical protein